MSHGNVTVGTGTCPVCERIDVDLCRYWTKEGAERFACVDEFACLAAYNRWNRPRVFRR